MILSHRHRFIFLKTRKTAGTSIEVWLQQHCGAEDVVTPVEPPEPGHLPRNHRGLFDPRAELRGLDYFPDRPLRSWKWSLHDLLRRRRFYNHISARLVRDRIPAEVWDGYWKWCVERPAVDKVVSDYFMQRAADEGLSMDAYLAGHPLPINHPIYCDRDGRPLVDQVIPYASLQQELGALAGRLGIPFDGLRSRAKGSYKPAGVAAQDVVTPAHRAHILEAFAEERRIGRALGLDAD